MPIANSLSQFYGNQSITGKPWNQDLLAGVPFEPLDELMEDLYLSIVFNKMKNSSINLLKIRLVSNKKELQYFNESQIEIHEQRFPEMRSLDLRESFHQIEEHTLRKISRDPGPENVPPYLAAPNFLIFVIKLCAKLAISKPSSIKWIGAKEGGEATFVWINNTSWKGEKYLQAMLIEAKKKVIYYDHELINVASFVDRDLQATWDLDPK